MDEQDLRWWRLRSHRLAGPGVQPPAGGGAAVVRRLGAVQSQDHEPALWSLAQRAPGVSRAELAAAFDAGAFIRTHVLRPTWHFVPPEELRDLLALTGPRVAASCAARWRELGLPAHVRADATRALVTAIGERGPLTRPELGEALEKAGIDPGGQRLPHLLLHAELETVLCSGGLRGRLQTWALVDDRVPPGRGFDRDAALRRLTLRYVTSHGPVTERDFSWWSGLTLRDVRRGLEAARPEIDAIEFGGRRVLVRRTSPAGHALRTRSSGSCRATTSTSSRTRRAVTWPIPTATERGCRAAECSRPPSSSTAACAAAGGGRCAPAGSTWR